ncbi:MAG: tetratricopeptide repeat protein [Pseudomonadota bacterium]
MPDPRAACAALFLAVPMFLGTNSESLAQTSAPITKPLDGPELEGPILRPGANSEADTTEPKSDRPADLAFGAYQRGYYLTALQLALPRAETGDPAAQTLIAELYWNGQGVARDREKAAEWYRFAADAGNSQAQFAYANILLQGKYAPLDKAEGQAFMEKAAQAGHVRAQFNLAQLITNNRPTWAGFKQALPWYQKAAEAGLADAQYALANIHAEAKGVNFNDDELAREWLEKAAVGGFDTAQVQLGIWAANGRGGEKDEKAALIWFARAAAKNNVIAQNRLARMYAFGVGTSVDRIKAGAWHIVARRAGFNDAEMDRQFSALPKIDQTRAIELANRLSRRAGS